MVSFSNFHETEPPLVLRGAHRKGQNWAHDRWHPLGHTSKKSAHGFVDKAFVIEHEVTSKLVPSSLARGLWGFPYSNVDIVRCINNFYFPNIPIFNIMGMRLKLIIWAM